MCARIHVLVWSVECFPDLCLSHFVRRVATFVRHPPLRVWEGVGAPALDGEGRCVVVDLGSLVVFNVYVPNGGRVESHPLFPSLSVATLSHAR